MIKKLIPIFALIFLIASVSALGETIFISDYEVAYSYSSAEEGEKFTLTVSITNTGSLKEDVVFEIKDDTPFDVSGDDTWEIGDLNPDETKTETFRIEIDEDTDEGEYDLEFSLEDSDDDYEDEMEIEVSSDKPDLIIGNLASAPSIISPDQDDVKLEITIENIGGGDANFVRAKLILPEGFESSSSFSDSVNLGTIESKEGKTATFFIDTDEDIESGIHAAKLQLEYKEEIEEKTRTLDLNIPIKGKPQFEIITSKTSPAKIPTGTSGTLSITIRNIGEEDGEETSVRVFENADFPVEFDEKTSFIGTLEPGERGTATFELEIDNEGKENRYLVRVQTRTLDNNNILIEEHTVPVTVIKGEQTGFLAYLPLIIIVVVIIVIIYIIYRLLRKPKKK